MSAGTTGNFGKTSNCTWHLMSTSPYNDIKKMWFNISQSLSGDVPDSTVKMYTGDSFLDILKNKTNKGVTLDKKS
jgi:hypothetical protein